MTIQRREFLTAVAGLGGAALLQPASSAAQAQPDPALQVQQADHRCAFPLVSARVRRPDREEGRQVRSPGHRPRTRMAICEFTIPGYHPYAPRANFRREMSDVPDMLKKMDARGVNMCTLTQTNPHVPLGAP